MAPEPAAPLPASLGLGAQGLCLGCICLGSQHGLNRYQLPVPFFAQTVLPALKATSPSVSPSIISCMAERVSNGYDKYGNEKWRKSRAREGWVELQIPSDLHLWWYGATSCQFALVSWLEEHEFICDGQQY